MNDIQISEAVLSGFLHIAFNDGACGKTLDEFDVFVSDTIRFLKGE